MLQGVSLDMKLQKHSKIDHFAFIYKQIATETYCAVISETSPSTNVVVFGIETLRLPPN